jgi:hypothetical protein
VAETRIRLRARLKAQLKAPVADSESTELLLASDAPFENGFNPLDLLFNLNVSKCVKENKSKPAVRDVVTVQNGCELVFYT